MNTGSPFCVASGFDVEAFQEEYLNTLSDDFLTADAAEDRLIRSITVATRYGTDCNWSGRRSLRELADDCRWLVLMTDNYTDSMLRELKFRSGAKSLLELRQKASRGIARCEDYMRGFLSISTIAEEMDPNPAFCMEDDDFKK